LYQGYLASTPFSHFICADMYLTTLKKYLSYPQAPVINDERDVGARTSAYYLHRILYIIKMAYTLTN
jgi:hypothetical protein